MRYAGFWPRLAAIFIDLLIISPLIGVSFWSISQSRTTALLLAVPLTLLSALYNIYFVGRWGQTIGKAALKIKVVALDGSHAGFRRGFARHSVDLGFSIISAALIIHALSSVSSYAYDTRSFQGKLELVGQSIPSWSGVVDGLTYVWMASELVVLLFNEKRRALHDFIAGTVVVHTKEADVGA